MNRIKKWALCTVSGFALYSCGTTKGLVMADKSPIRTTLDLVDVVDDKVTVTVDPGSFTTDMVSFYIPKTVPGTYSTDNYGQYIENFRALDYDGNALEFFKKDENTWNIFEGKKLDKVSYQVNDTYDTEAAREKTVFSPAGTNIVKDETFMLNLHGFIGYFKNLKEVPYEIVVTVPENLKPTTTLAMKPKTPETAGTDTFLASRYFEVIDNPILYAEPNTESFQLNDIMVRLSVYSPNGVYKAADLRPKMEKMMTAQKAFLGEVNSTKNYDILLHLSKMDSTDAGGFGALEHHTSTVVVLPEALPKDRLEEAMIDVVSHEFFHTVTPLNVHSKEVQYFDFNDPKMSRHLWMYEGTTEYFANLFQVQQGLIDETEFYERMMVKITNAKSYDDDMSFTLMSEKILEQPYEKNYANVYEKGALINMVLDIELRRLSNGEKGVLWLMNELSKKYGKDVPFEDNQLIDEIVAMTYPEIRTFFDAHVIGGTPIDYSSYLAKVGLTFEKGERETGYFLDGDAPFIDVDTANDTSIFIRTGIPLSSFFNDLGAEGGDVIQRINETPVSMQSIRALIGESYTWSPDKEISMTVIRNGQEVVLKGTAGKPMLHVESIVPVKTLSAEQAMLREAWLKS